MTMNDGALLRQADWRFLVPSPPEGMFRHVVLRGGGDELRAVMIGMGIARTVSDGTTDERADALVVLAAERDPLHAIRSYAHRLTPGGVVYIELRQRRWAGSGASLRQVVAALDDADVVCTGQYWTRPDFARRALYLPVDSSAAVLWYLRTVFRRTTLARRLTQVFLAAMIRVMPGSLPYAIRDLAVTGIVPTVVGRRDRPLIAAAASQAPSTMVVLTGGIDEQARVVGLPFERGRGEPWAIWKSVRRPEYNQLCLHEQAVLRHVRRRLTPAMQRAIPQPCGIARAGRLVVTAESVQTGVRLVARHQRGRVRRAQLRELRRIGQWLAAFHNATRCADEPWNDAAVERWIAPPLERYRQTVVLTGAERALFDATLERARRIEGRLPIVWQHHDFNELNIISRRDDLGVIDWERSRSGPAACDLAYLVLRFGFVIRDQWSPAQQLAGFHDLFVRRTGGDAYVRTARAVIQDYLAALGLEPAAWDVLLVVTWVEHALDHAERATRLGTDRTRDHNPYCSFVDHLATAGWLGQERT